MKLDDIKLDDLRDEFGYIRLEEIKKKMAEKLREFGERLKKLTPGMGQHESEMLAREIDKELKELQ